MVTRGQIREGAGLDATTSPQGVSGPVSGHRWEEGACQGFRLAAGDSFGQAIWSPPLAPHSVCVPVPGEAGHVGSPPELRSHAPPDVTGAPTATGPRPLQIWTPPAGPPPPPLKVAYNSTKARRGTMDWVWPPA